VGQGLSEVVVLRGQHLTKVLIAMNCFQKLAVIVMKDPESMHMIRKSRRQRGCGCAEANCIKQTQAQMGPHREVSVGFCPPPACTSACKRPVHKVLDVLCTGTPSCSQLLLQPCLLGGVRKLVRPLRPFSKTETRCCAPGLSGLVHITCRSLWDIHEVWRDYSLWAIYRE
jgi:hypothetical protein